MKKFKNFIIDAEVKWNDSEILYENNGFGLINKSNTLYIVNISNKKWIDNVKNKEAGVVYIDKIANRKKYEL